MLLEYKKKVIIKIVKETGTEWFMYSMREYAKERKEGEKNETVGRMWDKFFYGRGLKRCVIPVTVSAVADKGDQHGVPKAPLMPTEQIRGL